MWVINSCMKIGLKIKFKKIYYPEATDDTDDIIVLWHKTDVRFFFFFTHSTY